MATIDEMVRNLALKHSNRIRKICDPLNRIFGINHFFMSYTTAQGEFFSIGNNLTMHEYYYCGEKFKLSPFHRNPSLIQPGIYSYRNSQNLAFHQSLDDVREKTNVEIALMIAVKKQESLTRFGYCVSPEIGSNKGVGLLLKNLTLLEKFNTYFVDEVSGIINNACESSVNLPKEMGNLYTISLEETPLELALDSRLAFLKSLQLLDKQVKITRRELGYLSYIAKGVTCIEMAQFMHLSVRTIENMILNLKEKLGCQSKSDLTGLAQLLFWLINSLCLIEWNENDVVKGFRRWYMHSKT